FFVHSNSRASFHPICAREVGNRLEIWGKHGCDTVELRAFCSKHSDIQDSGRPINGGNINAADPPVLGAQGTCSDISRNSELQELESPRSEFDRSATNIVESGMTERSTDNEKNRSESLSFVLILKKLINLGKVDVKDVVAEIGVNPDALNAKLMEPQACTSIKKFKAPLTVLKCRAANCTEGIVMLDSDIVDPAEICTDRTGPQPNAWLHPTATQSAAAFLHLPVEDEIWGRNGGGQRSDGRCDLVPWANKFVTIASMHCKLLM
ncbi:unnamed protein product, partial [Brassica rapa subsp. trilocularis]